MFMATQFASKPVHVKDVLIAAIPEIHEHMLGETIRGKWRELVGPTFSLRSRPGALKSGALDVVADNSSCLHEMTLRSGEILDALQARHGSAVSSLRFSLGIVTTSQPATATQRRTAPAQRLPPEEAEWVDTAVAPIANDPALAGSLRRLLTKDLMARAHQLSANRPTRPGA